MFEILLKVKLTRLEKFLLKYNKKFVFRTKEPEKKYSSESSSQNENSNAWLSKEIKDRTNEGRQTNGSIEQQNRS